MEVQLKGKEVQEWLGHEAEAKSKNVLRTLEQTSAEHKRIQTIAEHTPAEHTSGEHTSAVYTRTEYTVEHKN